MQIAKKSGNVTAVILTGYIGEVKFRMANTKNGQVPVATFGIQHEDDREAAPKWANVECWRELADFANTMQKGDYCVAIGTVVTDTYNGKETKKLDAREIYCRRADERNRQFVLERMESLWNMVDPPKDVYRRKPAQQMQDVQPAQTLEDLADSDEELPF